MYVWVSVATFVIVPAICVYGQCKNVPVSVLCVCVCVNPILNHNVCIHISYIYFSSVMVALKLEEFTYRSDTAQGLMLRNQ